MIINKKKYEKLNNDLVDVKVKAFNDVKKALDGENKIMRLCLQIKHQRDQYKAERDTLIDDIAVLKVKNEELENIEKLLNKSRYKQSKTIEQLKERLRKESFYYEWQNCIDENKQLKQENKALRLQSNTYFDEWQSVKNNTPH